MVFEIPLTEQKVKPHQVTALHLVVGFALLAWSAIALLINNIVFPIPNAENSATQSITIEQSSTLDIIGGVVMAVSFIIIIASLFRNKWLRGTTVNQAFRIIELLLLIGIAIHLLMIVFTVLAMVFGLLAGTIIFSLFWEGSKDKTLTVTVNDKGISLPMRRKSILWTEVETTLLRHGTLTVNCTDNRLFQWVTSNHNIDHEIFEAYCLAQIEAAKKNRKQDNW